MQEVWKSEYSIALAAIVAAIVFKIWWSRRRFRQLASEIPGLPTLPLIGNLHQYLGEPEQIFCTLRKQWIQSGGRNFRFWMGPLLYVVITTPEDVEEILVNKRALERDRYLMKILRKIGGNGLGTCSTKTWKDQRKMVAPALRPRALENYVDVFNLRSQILVDRLKKFADGSEFDVFARIVECSADMVSESTIGESMNAQMDDDASKFTLLERMLHITFKRMMRPWLIVDFIYDLTSDGRELRRGKEYLFNVSNKMVQKKLREYREMKSTGGVSGEWMKKGSTVVDNFIRLSETQGVELNEQVLRDEAITMLVASVDNEAVVICFTLMFLALHPEVQEGVIQELKSIFADDWDRDVTSADVKQMQLLDRVIKETMRVLPSLTFLPREIHEEVKLSNCTLPAGCLVLINTYFVHRDPRYFPDPERFDPDRWLPGRSEGRHPYCYIPFGAGPRMCVGFRYSEIVMAVVLATVLRKYRFLPVVTNQQIHDNLKVGLVMKPTFGFPIKMLPRE